MARPPAFGRRHLVLATRARRLPATPEIRKQLLAIKRHDVITPDGLLVEVAGTAGGACEVMGITGIHNPRR